jgi:hypothetical protein
MRTTMRCFTLTLVIGLICQSGIAGTVLGTSGQTCYPRTFTNRSATNSISVFGDWIENIDRATAPAGVTVTIAGKFNGAQNNSGQFAGKGKVLLDISTNNATPGTKTISLIDDPNLGLGGTTFTFTITVVASPTVTSVDAPSPADPFKEITVTLNGTGLQEAVDPAAGVIVIDNLVPFITVGGTATVSSVRVLSSSSTSLQAKILFSALIQDATVELSLRSTDKCVPLGVLPSPVTNFVPFKTRVRVKSSNVKNFVESFAFPTGSTIDKNSIGTINLNLLFAAPSSSGSKLKNGLYVPGLTSADNAKVFFKFVPDNAFRRPDGTPFPTISGGFVVVTANAGEDVIPISFKVIDCLGGQAGQTNVVKIQTWMHTTNTNLPPSFVEKTFNVRCIQ